MTSTTSKVIRGHFSEIHFQTSALIWVHFIDIATSKLFEYTEVVGFELPKYGGLIKCNVTASPWRNYFDNQEYESFPH